MAALLSLDSIVKRFGGILAVDTVSFELTESHGITALIGPNGAGKTSVINIVTGNYQLDSGTVFFCGEPIHTLPTHAIAARGIGRTFQNLELFRELTVVQNVMLGCWRSLRPSFWKSLIGSGSARAQRDAHQRAVAALEFCGIAHLADTEVHSLSFGTQRWVEIARALTLEPALLLMDEPAAGLTLTETAALGDLLRQIAARGISILLVEHEMDLVMNVSDHVIVLNQGALLAQGTPREIQQNQAVIDAYLGS
ncbi:ABC transporter ATP-binding protein [Chrysiogenes arsenatis]|uniref:ABC transporter ATP-binding protein n=1 Tax=Chrysiogenes arsenatis TaxID=309797 RepID=UPI000406B814|nr:ABC transporter ATP-binding protein [Chrysiogenes arsenatis]